MREPLQQMHLLMPWAEAYLEKRGAGKPSMVRRLNITNVFSQSTMLFEMYLLP